MKLVLLFCLSLYSTINHSKIQTATFAGGCFWCMEYPFEKLVGVKSVISGYAGGAKHNPTYKEVSSGKTKHREVVQVTYDSSLVSYKRLLEIFWMNINPTDSGGQFVDRGFQYSSAIFFHDDLQRSLAKESIQLLVKKKVFEKSIVTPIISFSNFYPAEEYHQNYYRKNALTKVKYKYYRNASGRDEFIKKYWNEKSKIFIDTSYKVTKKKNIKKALSSMSFKVTQEDGTEPPFKNKFWDNKEKGIYVDIVSREPLFSSQDKYKSGTGWPSFYRPLEANNIVEFIDDKLFSTRVEVRSRYGDSHLGHVFKDGPKPTGLRYCINSAALDFVHLKDLKEKGLGEYLYLFK